MIKVCRGGTWPYKGRKGLVSYVTVEHGFYSQSGGKHCRISKMGVTEFKKFLLPPYGECSWEFGWEVSRGGRGRNSPEVWHGATVVVWKEGDGNGFRILQKWD